MIMDIYEVKEATEKAIRDYKLGDLFYISESKDHIRLTSDDLEISIQAGYVDDETNVYLDYQYGGLNYQLTAFRATPQTLNMLFTEYKRIKGE